MKKDTWFLGLFILCLVSIFNFHKANQRANAYHDILLVRRQTIETLTAQLTAQSAVTNEVDPIFLSSACTGAPLSAVLAMPDVQECSGKGDPPPYAIVDEAGTFLECLQSWEAAAAEYRRITAEQEGKR